MYQYLHDLSQVYDDYAVIFKHQNTAPRQSLDDEKSRVPSLFWSRCSEVQMKATRTRLGPGLGAQSEQTETQAVALQGLSPAVTAALAEALLKCQGHVPVPSR
jgi:hypothetical protein